MSGGQTRCECSKGKWLRLAACEWSSWGAVFGCLPLVRIRLLDEMQMAIRMNHDGHNLSTPSSYNILNIEGLPSRQTLVWFQLEMIMFDIFKRDSVVTGM